ncbi:MAG: hypothetical protein WBC44_03000 [Planctomycetaceae bacterium]
MDSISFGDTVRVCSTPVTADLGLAGMIGQVYGETTPSITGVDVIGESEADFAIAVMFDERGDTFWFSPDSIEFIDHSPGTRIEIAGHRRVRDARGVWHDQSTEPWLVRALAWLFRPFRASR